MYVFIYVCMFIYVYAYIYVYTHVSPPLFILSLSASGACGKGCEASSCPDVALSHELNPSERGFALPVCSSGGS